MTVRVLSIRHRQIAGWCDACGRNVGRDRFVATMLVGAEVIKMCRPCLREAARIAGEVVK